MARMMTKAAIIDQLSKKSALTKKQMSEILDSLATLAQKEAKNGFIVPGLGKLVLVQRKARMGRNPQTGAPIRIPAKRVVRFRVAKVLKDSVLGKK